MDLTVVDQMTASIEEFQLRRITGDLLGPPGEWISKDNIDGKLPVSHDAFLVRASVQPPVISRKRLHDHVSIKPSQSVLAGRSRTAESSAHVP